MTLQKKFYFRWIACLLLFALQANISTGQNYLDVFDNLGIDNGLSHSWVSCFVQDKHGFIWVGTKDGLNRFDGLSFTTYYHVIGKPNSLPDNEINTLFLDADSNLWIGTNKGLAFYNERKDNFQIFNPDASNPDATGNINITAIAEDKNKNLWVGTVEGGLYKITKHDQGKENSRYYFTRAMMNSHVPNSIPSNNVWTISFDKNNMGWLGTEKGLCRFNPEPADGKLLRFDTLSPVDQLGFSHGAKGIDIWKITQDSEGNLWFISFHKIFDVIPAAELNKPVRAINVFQCYDKISAITFSAKSVPFTLNTDANKNFWMGISYEGMLKFRARVEKDGVKFSNVEDFHHDELWPRSLVGDNVQAGFQDRSGSFWVGTTDGVSVYHKSRANFSSPVYRKLLPSLRQSGVTCITESKPWLFVGTVEKGLFVFNTQSEELKNFKQLKYLSETGTMKIQTMTMDHTGNLWMIENDTLVRISKSSLEWNLQQKSNRLEMKSGDLIYSTNTSGSKLYGIPSAICEDKNGMIWIGTGRGVNRYHPESNSFERMPLFEQTAGKEIRNGNIIRDVFMDSKGEVWFATDDGLVKYKEEAGKFISEKISFSNNTDQKIKVSTIAQAGNSDLLIGTMGSGLFRLNTTSKEVFSLTKQNGLPNEIINGILCDEQQNIWCSTNKGISKITPNLTILATYDYQDGLNSDEFYPNAAFRDHHGILIFGNHKGLSAFQADSISPNSYIPPVVITEFEVLGLSNGQQADTIQFQNRILDHQVLKLSPLQNNFSIAFAALNYSSPEKNNYQYWLIKSGCDTISTGYHNFASFTNLDPGDYIFYTRASNNSGVWTPVYASLSIDVTPHYYQTSWFRILAALVSFTIVFVYYRMRLRNLDLRKDRELALHKTQMKEEFLANMSHEIRTPLNAIMGMTRLLRDKDPKPDQEKYLEAIYQSSDHLLVIINDILDISKIDAGKVQLEKIPFSLRSVINSVHTTLRFKAEEKGLTFQEVIPDNIPDHLIGDPVRLSQILINLSGNAIKFTEHGEVSISCEVENVAGSNPESCRLHFIVRDTGIGIAEENLGVIFESFTQGSSSTTRKFGGTGLGLAISKKLVEMQGGVIYVESTLGKGSVFHFAIVYEISKQPAIPYHQMEPSLEVRESLKGIEVLLVEDNKFNRIVAIDTLKAEINGIQIDVAVNGKQAVEKVSAKHYDVVLMDVQMPIMNGYDATRIIRTLPAPANDTCIIAMTASALGEGLERCFDAGMNDFVAKPFNTEELLIKIQQLVRKS